MEALNRLANELGWQKFQWAEMYDGKRFRLELINHGGINTTTVKRGVTVPTEVVAEHLKNLDLAGLVATVLRRHQ